MWAPLVGQAGYVYSVAFASDGAAVASGGADGAVMFWDLADRPRPRPLGEPLAAQIGSVNAVALAPAAPTLAVGGGDASVRLWDLGPLWSVRTAPTDRACAITGRGLDRDEWSRYVSGLAYRDTCARGT
jgi:WD40 repeat protein